jgi:REP element-mobilizing transposase RayT
MSYTRRSESESELYHVMCRGVSRQIIFEDDADRQRFLDDMKREQRSAGTSILAWCLMDNHVHLLIKADKAALARFMQRTLSSYARYFNERHDRVGHLFQDRYKSTPIDTDTYLLMAVVYIHRNPLDEGITDLRNYRWSSYHEYLGISIIADTRFVLDMFDSIEEFDEFNQTSECKTLLSENNGLRAASNTRAALIAAEELGVEVERLNTLPRDERNRHIARLLERGLSIRQIERLTGVSRGIVAAISKRLNS